MANIKLARVDFRLMHGQVVTGWLHQVNADTILIVNDELAKDKFLAQVFLMAAPPGVKVLIRSTQRAIEEMTANKYGNRNLLVLFKNIESAYKAVMSGFPLKSLQVGGVNSSPEKKQIDGVLFINDEEIQMVKEMDQKNIEVYFQVTPKHNVITLEDALKIVE